jgi:hypothetical protein
MADTAIQPFRVEIPKADLDDLSSWTWSGP